MANREELEQKTKEELLEEARERDLEGRSSMNKDELVDALASDSGSSDGEKVSEGGDEVQDAEDLLTPTGPYRGHLQNEAEAALSAGNPVPGEDDRPVNPDADERMQDLEEKTPEAAKLAAEELDYAGPLHLQSPEERIMTGAVSEEQAEEQKKLLANMPEGYVGEVTEAGFDEDGNVKTTRRLQAPLVEVVDEEAADSVGKESRGERRERQGLPRDTDEDGNPLNEEEQDQEASESSEE